LLANAAQGEFLVFAIFVLLPCFTAENTLGSHLNHGTEVNELARYCHFHDFSGPSPRAQRRLRPRQNTFQSAWIPVRINRLDPERG
jgi:hypothetical protein